jgi:hypothetical protein
MSVDSSTYLESRLVTKNKPCRLVFMVSKPGYDVAGEFISYGEIFWFQSLDKLKLARFYK